MDGLIFSQSSNLSTRTLVSDRPDTSLKTIQEKIKKRDERLLRTEIEEYLSSGGALIAD